MNLYVQAHSKVVLILLAEEGLDSDSNSIKALVSRGAFHLCGKTGENFLANGAVQFFNKHSCTGRV